MVDVGGGQHGSHMIGQFHERLNGPDTERFYIFNPYRVWSGNINDIEETAGRVLGSARLKNIKIIANPNMGIHSSVEDVISGLEKTKDILGPEADISFVCVREAIAEEVKTRIEYPVLPVKIMTIPDWMNKQKSQD